MKIAFSHVTTTTLISVLALSPATYAGSLGGVTLPESIEVSGKTLVLNGLGMRKATMLKVNVYVVGLYLERKSNDATQILKSRERKRVVMHYVRDVDAGRIREGWRKGFKKNYLGIDAVKAEVDNFLTTVVDMKKGDRVVIDLVDRRVEVQVKGGEKVTIETAAFQEAILAVWLGRKPPNAELKKGLLGL